MNLSVWFDYQLKAIMDGFAWAVNQVPVERRETAPPLPFGEWSVKRHIFHLNYYTRTLALPHMRHWLGQPLPSFEERNEERVWQDQGEQQSVEALLTEFHQLYTEQLVLLRRFDATLWQQIRPSVWGDVDMQWIITKSYQHTTDHINTVLSMALFWDSVLR